MRARSERVASKARPRVAVVDDLDGVSALAHPMRVAILDALRAPDSAAGVARALGQPRQRTNYHVKALLDAGLVKAAGERRNGNFVEQLYQAAAGTFVISPRLSWGGSARVDAMSRQLPLEHLVELGERVQREATELLDRAAFDGEEIPSLAIDAEVRFDGPEQREAFAREYLAAIKPLLRKYGSRKGEGYRVAIAAYPTTEGR